MDVHRHSHPSYHHCGHRRGCAQAMEQKWCLKFAITLLYKYEREPVAVSSTIVGLCFLKLASVSILYYFSVCFLCTIYIQYTYILCFIVLPCVFHS